MHELYMQMALQEAQAAVAEDEVPVGAVIAHGERVIASAHNQREMLKDPTAHAEMIAITQAAVSQHLKVLRESGFATVRADGARRIYAVDVDPLQDVDAWLDRFRRFWEPKLDALETEIVRGRRKRR